MMGIVVVGWMWVRMAKLAQERESGGGEVPKGIQARLTDDAIDHLDQLRHE